MNRWHINPSNKSIGRCNAEVGNCPFGGESGMDNHFDSLQDAKKGYEKFMANETLVKHSKDKIFDDDDNFKQIELNLKNVKKEHDSLKNLKKAIEDKTPNFKYSEKWFTMTQKIRDLHYDKMALEEERLTALPKDVADHERQREREKLQAKQLKLNEWFENLKAEGNFSYHPDITHENEHKILDDMSAFSGISEDEIKQRVSDRMIDENINRSNAYRKIWKELPLRTDKPIVAIDLETSNPIINGRVDNGPYTTIIEVGYIKIDGKTGNFEKKSYLSGIPENLKKTIGTGSVDVHHITNEMVEGKTVFVNDGKRQEELLSDLRGSVIIAHNASYEINQFRHSLKGFNRAIDSGDVQVVDTKDISSFLMPDNPDNTNKSLVESTGGSYDGAHRAYEDAAMTLNALFRSKNIDEVKL